MASQQLVTVHKWEGENGSQWFALRRSGGEGQGQEPGGEWVRSISRSDRCLENYIICLFHALVEEQGKLFWMDKVCFTYILEYKILFG